MFFANPWELLMIWKCHSQKSVLTFSLKRPDTNALLPSALKNLETQSSYVVQHHCIYCCSCRKKTHQIKPTKAFCKPNLLEITDSRVPSTRPLQNHTNSICSSMYAWQVRCSTTPKSPSRVPESSRMAVFPIPFPITVSLGTQLTGISPPLPSFQ